MNLANETSIKKLAALLDPSKETRPVFLIGAGASYRSGIPVAADAVKEIAKAAYARNVLGKDTRQVQLSPSQWMNYLRQQSWFINDPGQLAENYPLAIEHLLVPREFRKEVLADLAARRTKLNAGYKAMARLCQKHLLWTILTTNFDTLIVDALSELTPRPRKIFEINKVAGDHVAFSTNNRCQVIYLHGAIDFYTDQNLTSETSSLNPDLVPKLRQFLCDSPLVIVGYRGYEKSIMKSLLDDCVDPSVKFRHGIYWCTLHSETLHPNVTHLADRIGNNFIDLRIDGFDELLYGVDAELAGAQHPYAVLFSDGTQNVESQDAQVVKDVSMGDMDASLLTASLTEYCKRLSIAAPSQDNLFGFLMEYGFACMIDGILRPTFGAYLMFGKDVTVRFPHLKTSVIIDDKRRAVFEGCLIHQLRQILTFIQEETLNPVIRIKRDVKAEEAPAYPPRVLTELIVNCFAHRDYSMEVPAEIRFVRGEMLSVSNAGGLNPSMHARVTPTKDVGLFTPIRSLSYIRNPVISEILFGLGYMDKQGSGLADTAQLLANAGGRAQFFVRENNAMFVVHAWQPKQEHKNAPAMPLQSKQSFLCNILPFVVSPTSIFRMPLAGAYAKRGAKIFTSDEEMRQFPVCIKNGGYLWSFANIGEDAAFAKRIGYLDYLEEVRVSELLADQKQWFFIPWLLGYHWVRFLESKADCNLLTVRQKKKAYFRSPDGKNLTVKYNTPARTGVERDVVKKREFGQSVQFECEGIAFSVEVFGTEWGILVKPIYVFTERDGVTPIRGILQGKKSTSRYKFDRNVMVEKDLQFWAIFLSGGQPTIDIGGMGVKTLIVDANYCTVDVEIDDALALL